MYYCCLLSLFFALIAAKINGSIVPVERATLPDVLNPDRGIYKHTETRASAFEPLSPSDLQSWRDNEAISLIYRVFVLDTFTRKDISSDYLTMIRNDLTIIKDAYMKVILRFCYSLDTSKDANQTQAVRHIQQLAPIIKDYAMIISVVQAGFIGKFGEWFYTDNMKTRADRLAIVDALLAAVPQDIMIQVRTPAFKQEKCGTANLTTQTALTGAACARIGIFNDCFLAPDNDQDTFRSDRVAADQTYFATNSLYTPAGGEMCEVNSPRTDCPGAMAEIKKYHYTFLNKDWHEVVVPNWVKANCYTAIKSMLGYRYQLGSPVIPSTITRGRTATFTFPLSNTGVASLFNLHPTEIILRSGSTVRYFPQPQIDARRWAPGASQTVSASFTVPTDLPTGSYEVLLHIYDPKRPTNKYNRIVVINSGVATSERFNKLGITTVA